MTEIKNVVTGDLSYDEFNKQSCLDGKPIEVLKRAIFFYTQNRADRSTLYSAMHISFNLYANSLPESLAQSVHEKFQTTDRDRVGKLIKENVVDKYLKHQTETIILPPKIVRSINNILDTMSKTELINMSERYVELLEDLIKI